jgi:2-iminobutanoate/2-iminopropanoate deaminase
MQHYRSDAAPAPGGPYSHAVRAGDLIFLSGQRPQDPATGEIPQGLTAQARQVFTNLAAVLQLSECGFEDVVRVGVYLADIAFFDEFNAVYREFFEEPFPARTTVGCVLRGILIEVDVVAQVRPAGGDLG